jgi:Trimethylamine:corrinoid methyltransferase
MPGLIDRSRYEEWVTKGKKTMGERVIEKTQRLLLEHKPEPLPDDVVARVKSIVERAEAEFRIQKAS